MSYFNYVLFVAFTHNCVSFTQEICKNGVCFSIICLWMIALEVIFMNFNVVICEDVKSTISKISSFVFEYFENAKFEIDCHQLQNNFEKAIEYAKNTDGTRNIYLLDIDLKDNINGLTLAQKIREYDYLGYIIFITSHTEVGMTALSYKLKILDFIDKANPNYKAQLFDCFDTIVKESTLIKAEDKHIIVKSGTDYFPLVLNDIIYIETDSIGRKTIIHTYMRTIETYIPLKELQGMLDKRFFRCHRAIIVNTDKIKMISNDRKYSYLELSCGNVCPFSSRKTKELMEFVGRGV